MLALAVLKFNLRPKDFWELTFGEWYPIYNAVIGKTDKPMTKDDVKDLEEHWANGNTRRIDS